MISIRLSVETSNRKRGKAVTDGKGEWDDDVAHAASAKTHRQPATEFHHEGQPSINFQGELNPRFLELTPSLLDKGAKSLVG